MADSGIYEIVNLVNGKRYVGSAVSLERRWREHRWGLNGNRHGNRHLQASWAKHGESAFAFQIIEYCDPGVLIEREQAAFRRIKPEYNICPVAGSTLGRPHSDETKAKIGAKKCGLKMPPRSPEHRAKLSEAIKRRPPNPDAVAKMSATKKGKRLPDEHKAKIAIALKAAWDDGKRQRSKSAEWRAKIALSLSGKKLTVEHRAAVAAAMTGKKRGPYKLSEQERRARSERAKESAAKRIAARWPKASSE
jgi:group I intron endonuclease